jgi:uncharacterized membrane protein
MIAAILLSTLIPVVLLVGIVYVIFKITNKESSNFMSPKEFGMELGIFVSLVSSVGALISVVFTAIDKKYPDVLANASYVSSPMNEDVRMAISILFVAFPLYLVLAWARAKYFEKNADRRNITSLKWPHYVTIFVSLFSIATSVVVTIYYYLGGELVARFGLKMLTVLVILLGLAAYHYFLVKRDYSKKSLIPLVFTLISSVLVLGSIIYSINVLGSPSEIRKQRFEKLAKAASTLPTCSFSSASSAFAFAASASSVSICSACTLASANRSSGVVGTSASALENPRDAGASPLRIRSFPAMRAVYTLFW